MNYEMGVRYFICNCLWPMDGEQKTQYASGAGNYCSNSCTENGGKCMIHILCADISSADKDCYHYLYEKASPERKKQADRYRRQEDKLRCLAAYALLRRVLDSEECLIEKNEFGKPYIRGREDFYYNLSHSGRYVVIAWGSSEIGVDVQQHDCSVDIEAIAKRFFTADEQSYIQKDLLRFYEIWTKKESYLKYTGKGLQKDLGSFSSLVPDSGIRYHHRYLEGGYSLCLCTTENQNTFELLDVQQLALEHTLED